MQRFTALILGLVFFTPVLAHFQMIIPNDDIIEQGEKRDVGIKVQFWHPFEGHGMNMEKPAKFGVLAQGKHNDLLDLLKPGQLKDMRGENVQAFTISYPFKKPGDHIFFTEPKPYWEESEESFIIHYTKVVVNGFGLEEGWDQEVGLKTEIVPLTRPYGLYAGNVFQGVVKLDGKPAPFSVVEVEYYNETKPLKAPAGPFITQIVKCDANGVFTYAMPKAGWWGFAALHTAKEKMQRQGKAYPVELGALIWVKTHSMP